MNEFVFSRTLLTQIENNRNSNVDKTIICFDVKGKETKLFSKTIDNLTGKATKNEGCLIPVGGKAAKIVTKNPTTSAF